MVSESAAPNPELALAAEVIELAITGQRLAVPGYRITALEPPRSRKRPSSEGPAAPDSTWEGRAVVESLGAYSVQFRASDYSGTLVLDRLTIEFAPLEGDELAAGIGPAQLRSLSIPSLLQAIKREALYLGLAGNWPTGDPATRSEALARTADLYRPVKAKRPRRIGDDQLRELAELRLLLDEEGDPAPVAEMARILNYAKSTVTDRLNRATEEGWLAPATKGARRRAPGWRLIEVRRLENEAQKGAEDG